MQFTYFFGIDISKNRIDVAVLDKTGQKLASTYFANQPEVIQKGFKKLCKQLKTEVGEVLICAENTGIYGNPLVQVTTLLQFSLWLENGRTIKRCTGLSRGKSDPLDALRIALYALRYVDKVRLWSACDKSVQELKYLCGIREDLMIAMNRITVPTKEAERFDSALAELRKTYTLNAIQALKQQLKEVEKQIDCLLEKEKELQKTVELVSSVPGIGRITSLSLVMFTNNFKLFEKASQLACYAGVAPFPYQSGSSVRGRTRVSPMAQKQLKKILHMAALSAVRFCKQIKAYYIRKVAEGKNKMSVLNAVRNKLIHIVFAVIKRGTPYKQEWSSDISVSNENKIPLAF